MQFVDECKIYIKAGNGGKGIVSWRREAHVGEGGPWGGNGGHGGNVIIVGDHNENSLFDLRNHKKIYAQDGGNGGTQMSSGKTGEPAIIKVPIGTSVYDSKTNELLCDILSSGQTFIACHAGRGGFGNAHFKNSLNRIPSLHENGDIGEERNITLKLRYIADVGLVGFPNAGKSTLVSQVSNAKPRIANYQFTTLTPVLGTVEYDNKKMVWEDVPGLIEGASEGKGLGHEFLKHIERCSILIHLISLDPQDNGDIVQAYETIKKELKKYSKEVASKPIFLVANKIDVEGAEENLKKLEKKYKKKVLAISAKEKTNIDELKKAIFDKYFSILEELKKLPVVEMPTEVPQDKDVKHDINIIKVDEGVYKVESKYLAYWFNRIPLDTADNMIRFNNKIDTVDAEGIVKKMGGKAGDTLIICNTEFVVE